MPISNLYPAEGPTLSLSFANSRKLDRRVTFTRTTGGTYMDSDGLIKYALPDCARFGHRYVNGDIESLGLLIEEQGQNIFPTSENFNSGWGGGGTINLDSSIFDPRGNTGTVYYPSVSEWTRNFDGGGVTFLTLSFFTKRNAINGGDSTRIQMYQETAIGEQSNVGSYNFSLTGTNSDSGRFTNIVRTEYPNGWYRFSARVQSNSQAGQGTFTNTSRVDLEGGFNSNYVWGIQVEPEVEFASSYIPTSGSIGDRGADNASMVGDNFTSWYNQQQGTFYSEHMTGVGRTSGGRHVYSADLNFQNRISGQFSFDPIENLNRFRSFVRSNGTIYGDFSPDNTAIEGVKNKTSQSYKLGKASQTLNGNTVGVTGEPSLLPSPITFEIGKYMGSYDYLNGYISQITYYPTAVTDTVLINLTK